MPANKDTAIDALIDKIKDMGNPTVVGLDTRLHYIPQEIKQKAFAQHGETPKGAAEAMFLFNKAVIDAVFDIVPAVKPQVAMYEQFGADGMSAYILTARYARARGMTVIGDIKRGDISSTAEAYSNGHLGRVYIEQTPHEIYQEDFVTVNPYMGADAVSPFLSDCRAYNKGIFVLVRTSNPSSVQLQELQTTSGLVYEHIGRLVAEWGKDFIGRHGFSSVGAVVGATAPEQAARLRQIMPRVFFLVPGYGAQGASAVDLSVCFKNKSGAIVNSSRGIIDAHHNEKYVDLAKKGFEKAIRQAAVDMRADLWKVL
ncbi:MAG: orotidine-5'-phosphate decarboxylase [Clostridiales bacterium]|jgi:orotidine-5'-phosphate decarboxylase|nr:orotidine-5'-phosphate decarboxylase [Clostridiales bacterium]